MSTSIQKFSTVLWLACAIRVLCPDPAQAVKYEVFGRVYSGQEQVPGTEVPIVKEVARACAPPVMAPCPVAAAGYYATHPLSMWACRITISPAEDRRACRNRRLVSSPA